MFNQAEKDELKGLYQKLQNLYGEKARLEVLKKQRENSLKEEMASVLNVESKTIKMPLLMALLNEKYNEKPNPKRIEFETMESYEESLKEANSEVINGLMSVNETINENKSDIKEAFKDSTLAGHEILKALDMLVKEEYKLMLNDALSKAGFEAKEPKDNSELESLMEMLKEVLK